MTLLAASLVLATAATAGVERRIVAATNMERRALGLHTLREDSRLGEAAQRHSDEMLRLGKLSHQSPTRGLETPSKRASEAGVKWRKVAENVAYYQGYRPAGSKVVADWMASPHHHANIVDPDFRLIGVATACGGDKCYVTQMFAVEPAKIDAA